MFGANGFCMKLSYRQIVLDLFYAENKSFSTID
jgi:hypothetical protein